MTSVRYRNVLLVVLRLLEQPVRVALVSELFVTVGLSEPAFYTLLTSKYLRFKLLLN